MQLHLIKDYVQREQYNGVEVYRNERVAEEQHNNTKLMHLHRFFRCFRLGDKTSLDYANKCKVVIVNST